MQLAAVHLLYPGATHTRYEHSLGVAHLANKFMTHLQAAQPELQIKEEHLQAVVLAGLCHDVGHGPWSHTFESFLHRYNPTTSHEDRSVEIMKLIISRHNIDIKPEIVEAAGKYIQGEVYEPYPKWLAQVIANKEDDIDLDKFDYLGRDTNRTLNIAHFEYERLIVNCRVIENKLAWKLSDMSTIDRMFYNRNDMFKRVYQHRVNQSLECMICDMLEAADEYLHLFDAADDIDKYISIDDRIMYQIENGEGGEEAQQIARRITSRNLYKCIAEFRMKPENNEGMTYSQAPESNLSDDIEAYDERIAGKLRVVKSKYRYGIKRDHPLLHIAFWKHGSNKIIQLSEAELSCIVPVHFVERAMRVYVTDNQYYSAAVRAVEAWKVDKHIVENQN